MVQPHHSKLPREAVRSTPSPLEKSQTAYLVKIERVDVGSRGLSGVTVTTVVSRVGEANPRKVVSRYCGATKDDNGSEGVAIAPGAV